MVSFWEIMLSQYHAVVSVIHYHTLMTTFHTAVNVTFLFHCTIKENRSLSLDYLLLVLCLLWCSGCPCVAQVSLELLQSSCLSFLTNGGYIRISWCQLSILSKILFKKFIFFILFFLLFYSSFVYKAQR